MKWIIPDALAPAALSQALGQALLSSAPDQSARLAALFDAYHAQTVPFHPSTHGCASYEWLQLQSLGLQSEQTGLPAGAYLAAKHAEITDPKQRVWLAQASSTLVTSERAVLIGLSDLQAQDADLLDLHESLSRALPLDEGPIRLKLLSPGVWQISGDFPEDAWLPSPAAVQGQDLGDWWPTAEHWKPWRRLLNEIQMFWHDHPINTRRELAGLPPINGLWLYGGGYGWTPTPSEGSHWMERLQTPARQGDWQRWIEQYRQVLEELLEQTQQDPHAEIILSGPDRIVTLRKTPASLLSRLTPRSLKKLFAGNNTVAMQPTSWSSWWNHA